MSGKEREVERLEHLWSGEFGDAYVQRNREAAQRRDAFWRSFLQRYPVERVLEVGCNLGPNLRWIAQHVAPRNVFGIDINERALRLAREAVPGVNPVWSTARELPFRDSWFDLVFTSGVLIHQPEETLEQVMAEVVRCSRRYVLCMEYFAPATTEVPYRDQPGTLFKRDYGRLYQEHFPRLRLLEQGALGPDDGWDDITWWLFAIGKE